MAEPLLTKDAINIGGHKFPIALIGGLAAVAGVLLVLRSRKASVGIGQAPTASTPYGSSFAPDNSAALANLSAQVASLQSSQQSSADLVAAATNPNSTAGSGLISIYGNLVSGKQPTVTGALPVGTDLWLTGNTMIEPWGSGTQLFEEVKQKGGGTFWISPADVQQKK